jgi:hypothetical protein
METAIETFSPMFEDQYEPLILFLGMFCKISGLVKKVGRKGKPKQQVKKAGRKGKQCPHSHYWHSHGTMCASPSPAKMETISEDGKPHMDPPMAALCTTLHSTYLKLFLKFNYILNGGGQICHHTQNRPLLISVA